MLKKSGPLRFQSCKGPALRSQPYRSLALLLPSGPTGQSSNDGASSGRAPLAVSCALAAGLLPALEARLRRVCAAEDGDEGSLEEFQSAARLVDLTLRRPGCWPALLAHGDPRQVGNLAFAIARKASCAAYEMQLVVWYLGRRVDTL